MTKSRKNKGFADKNAALGAYAGLSGQVLGERDLVYVLDPQHKYAFIFGKTKDCEDENFLDPNSNFHKEKHALAMKGSPVSYLWHVECRGKEVFFQTTLIPIKTKKGKVGNILGIIKDVTGLADSALPAAGMAEGKRKSLLSMLLASREEEKKKISSALHDELGSASVILNAMLAIIEEDVKENKKQAALKNIKELDVKFKKAVEKIKQVVISLRPPTLEHLGVESAVAELVENTREAAKMDIRFEYRENADADLESNLKTAIYRVTQEAISNIIKHSGASSASVELVIDKAQVVLIITDNGKGFKVSAARSSKQLGLAGMKENVKYLDGKIEIKSALGKGTKIRATFPKVTYTVTI